MIRVDNFNTQRHNKTNFKPSENVPKTRHGNFSSGQNSFGARKERRITLNEGMSILWSGVKQQCTDTVKSFFENPKALLGLLGFTAGLSLFPLIGIPVSAAGGAFAIGFAATASIKTVKHYLEFAKNNRNGQYNSARKNLKTLGEDSVDLALSLPFVPKSVSKIKSFAKYGKIKPAKDLTANHTIGEIIDNTAAGRYDAELERRVCFRKVAAKELNKNKNYLSKSELNALGKELEDYNVPYGQLPEVVLDKWSKAHDISVKPALAHASLPSNTSGCAVANSCTIVLNDYKTRIPVTSKYENIDVKIVDNIYSYTYRETSTGKIITEKVPKKIVDDYNELVTRIKTLSPQLSRIMTTIHEREHIDQYARMVITKGINIINPTPEGKFLYEQMVKEMRNQPRIAAQSKETAELIVTLKPENHTFANYLKRPAELGARKAEAEALKNPFYTHLDNVCKVVNAQKPKSAINSAILMNTVRVDSLAS